MSSDDDDSPPPQRQPHARGAAADDDEFEFEQTYSDQHQKAAASSGNPLKKTLDKPFDEVHEISDSNDDSLASPSTSPTAKSAAHKGREAAAAAAASAQSFDDSHDVDASDSAVSPPAKRSGKSADRESKSSKDKARSKLTSAGAGAAAGKPGNMAMSGKPGNVMMTAGQAKSPTHASDAPQKAGSSSDEEEDEEESDDDGGGGGEGEGAPRPAGSGGGLYNPADFANLVVSSEIQGLFEYIARHKPTDIELETKMKPFIPDYIPAVGEIDAFLKVPPPEEISGGKLPALGLGVLDEPAAHQSDPTVLDIMLRAVNKSVISKHAAVGSIEHAEKNVPRVLKWIASIEDVHRKKPAPTVHYSHPMPSIDSLMQVWPAEFEAMLQSQEFALPDMTHMECDVAQFARMVCAIMDIPVRDKVTESLHVLFTLYATFQDHAYFQH